MTHGSAYAGRVVTFATMHGKERLAREAFRDAVGATVVAPRGMDTDQFGTFAGDIPRTLGPRAAARAKARLGMQIGGTTLGLASEGSFSSGFAASVESREILLFIDDDRAMELVEGAITNSPLPGGRRIRSTDDALTFASAVGFPDQGVIVTGTVDNQTTAYKTLSQFAELERTVEALLRDESSVMILPDYRAHKAPSRAEVIRTLCQRMARRLSTSCPECEAPGFGQVDIERGLPCSHCASATQVIAADIQGCGVCVHRSRLARAQTRADPRWCDYCNP